MRSNSSKDGESPQRLVQLSSFWIDKYEVIKRMSSLIFDDRYLTVIFVSLLTIPRLSLRVKGLGGRLYLNLQYRKMLRIRLQVQLQRRHGGFQFVVPIFILHLIRSMALFGINQKVQDRMCFVVKIFVGIFLLFMFVCSIISGLTKLGFLE